MATNVWRKFANVYLSGKLQLKQKAKIYREDQVVEITEATATLDSEIHGNGRTIALNRAGGIALTLPGATGSGDVFNLIVTTTFTSDATIETSGTDDLTGLSVTGQAGTANAWPSGATADTFTLDGSTTGGLEGDRIVLTDFAVGLWSINHFGSATGVEATPFS